MKILHTAIAMIVLSTTYSQVGVGTQNPKSDLHISKTSIDGGSVQIDGGIRLGGNQTTIGDKGLPGQILMSDGENASAKWGTLGKTDGYTTDCGVPNKIATISIDLQDGSGGNEVNVASSQMLTALNNLPNGGIVLIRTRRILTYSNNVTRLTIQLPSAVSVLNKPFVIAFDGPINNNNSLDHNKNIEILVKATENNSLVYELSTISANRKFTINNFPSNMNSDYKVSELENRSGGPQPILMLNSYTITAINTRTWSFTNRDCSIRNPKI